jgi:hypothetical protein
VVSVLNKAPQQRHGLRSLGFQFLKFEISATMLMQAYFNPTFRYHADAGLL